MALTMVVSYDVTRDDRRAKLAALLQTWGDRIQYSVFLLTLAPEDLDGLLARVRDLINPGEDSVYFFRQCQTCWEAHHEVGQANLQPAPLYWAVL